MTDREVLKKLILRSLRDYQRNIEREHKKENGQWGYQVNVNFDEVIFYMLDNNLTSIVDLGAGIGHCLEIARRCGFQVKGYEVEEKLIREHKTSLPVLTVEQKDIMTLNWEDLKKYDVIYSWAPFHDSVKELLFLEYVTSMLTEDQVFLYFNVDRKLKIYENEKSL